MRTLSESPLRPAEVQVDWSRPVVVFDPWPFHDPTVQLKECWLLDSDGLSLGHWGLDKFDNVLAVATDGNYVVGSVASFQEAR